nr:protein adenylyltransferase SelO family protein [Antarcticibacterium arcticum]
MRVSESFLRFGNFEILAARKEKENLQQLVDWTIENIFRSIPERTESLTGSGR